MGSTLNNLMKTHLHKPLTASIEMYLLGIYRLTEHADAASTQGLAEQLGVRQPSVTAQLKKIAQLGLVDYAWREGACLTQAGRTLAIGLLRKNRILKTFLREKAGYGLHEIFNEACSLEHVVSDRLTEELHRMLGFPEIDPHGLPIPAHNDDPATHDRSPKSAGVLLNTVQESHDLRVISLDELDTPSLKYCDEHRLLPGHRFSFSSVKSSGEYTILLDGTSHVMSAQHAEHLTVAILP